LRSLDETGLHLLPGDVLVISSKIISKAENRFVHLADIKPSDKAYKLAQTTRKDPRVVELVLRESVEISRVAPHVLIVRHRLGFTSANAGIDQSNVGSPDRETVLLLPEDPDHSADSIGKQLENLSGTRPAIVISDTHGRPFRLGNLNVAIGISGLPHLIDQRGQVDLFGRKLQATITALADQIASAAGLVSGEADEGQPVILMRGLVWDTTTPYGTAKDIIRPIDQDLYR
jgi:coenzyme F420-0:L-glutamate ligase/coenzyme F420-1:gamma-L-glutamate ligase